MAIAVRVYGTILFAVACGGFLRSAVANEGAETWQRLMLGGLACSFALFGGLTIWAPHLLVGGKKK